MARTAFLEIILSTQGVKGAELVARDEIEDALEAALQNAQIGEITGAGAGMGKVVLDVEIDSLRVAEAIECIQQTLQEFALPAGCWIQGPEPSQRHAITHSSPVTDQS